jgi:membrane-associated phospholipid phosphatase
MLRITLCSVALIVLGALALGSVHADVVMDAMSLADGISDADERANPIPAETWSPKEEAAEIVAVAMFQAVNTVHPRYAPFRVALVPAPVGASAEAAAVAAAHAALISIFPDQKKHLDDVYALAIADIPETPERATGIAVGEQAAAQVIAARTADNAGSPAPFRPEAPPGIWVPTTPTTIPPYLWSGKPWLMSSVSQFRPKPPVALASAAWARDFNETKSLGGRDSSARSAEWTRLATFYAGWQHWPIVRQVAAQPGRTLEQNARLYALIAMAVSDANVAMVDGKLTYRFWRPITAIRNGDRDGNDATARQADWQPLLKTPMHPEYPCGHCVLVWALVTVLAAEAPPPSSGIAVTSDALPGAVRYVASYATLAQEISLSRIYAGAHFRASTEVGAELGRRVAEYELREFLQPVR